MRRAAVEVPAVAIFVIVAGALIVLFFVVLSQTQGERAMEGTQARSLQFIDSLLKSAATARETSNNITVIDDTLVFTCDSTGMRFGYENNVELPVHGVVTFAPRSLEGGVLLASTRPTDIPYYAFNVLFLASPSYVLEVDPSLASVLQAYPFETVPLASRQRRRGVISFASAQAGNVQAGDLVVEPYGDTFGTVTYVDSTGGPYPQVVYPTEELLIGALLSRDAETYRCVFDAWLDDVQFSTGLQRDRAALLKDAYAGTSCESKYQLFPFADILALPDAASFTPADAQALSDASGQIAFMNTNLLRGDGCASIY